MIPTLDLRDPLVALREEQDERWRAREAQRQRTTVIACFAIWLGSWALFALTLALTWNGAH